MGVINFGPNTADLVSGSGFGLTSASPVQHGNNSGAAGALWIQVNLALPMANTLYPISLQYYGPHHRFLSVAEDTVNSTTVSSFRLYIGKDDGNYYSMAQGWGSVSAGKLSFVVYGDQA
jgi:hypothetical protein